jgi:hypothetical protein
LPEAEIAYGGHQAMPFMSAKHHQGENAEGREEQAFHVKIAKSRPQIREGNSPEGDDCHSHREDNLPPRNWTSHANAFTRIRTTEIALLCFMRW